MSRPVLELVVGARPNFVKAAGLLRGCEEAGAPFLMRLVHTGQHLDASLSDVFFRELELPPPAVNLAVGSGPQGAQTAAILARYEAWLVACKPRPLAVVVVGDVNSTLAAALAAVKLGFPVVHVEAGLRSFDRSMPEEVNRVVVDAISDLLLVSEPSGSVNLAREGVDEARIRFVGNVMIDTLARFAPRVRSAPTDACYVTLHRPSNVDDPSRLARICEALMDLANEMPLSLSLHPRTRERIESAGLLGALGERVELLEPQPYLENLRRVVSSRAVVTDSGGLQEETTYLGIPCFTLREATERPATLNRGTNRLVRHDELEALTKLVTQSVRGPRPLIEGWDGHAGERVAQTLAARYLP